MPGVHAPTPQPTELEAMVYGIRERRDWVTPQRLCWSQSGNCILNLLRQVTDEAVMLAAQQPTTAERIAIAKAQVLAKAVGARADDMLRLVDLIKESKTW